MWLLTLAVLSGVSFSAIGVAYRVGQSRGIPTLKVAFGMGVGGAAVFAARAWGAAPADVPVRVWAFGLAVGLCQYAAIKLIQAALSRGPLSPVWCAVQLAFVAVIVYGKVFFGDPIEPVQYVGIAAGIGCVLAGSFQHRHARESARIKGTTAGYALILLLVFLFNCVNMIAVKDLSARTASSGQNYMDGYRDIYLALLHLTIALSTGVDIVVSRARQGSAVEWLVLSGVAGAGSVAGMSLLIAAARLPSAVVFTLNSVSAILSGAMISVLFLREKPTRAWFAMLALGLAAVMLVNLASAR